jgi:hypothetical protein
MLVEFIDVVCKIALVCSAILVIFGTIYGVSILVKWIFAELRKW